MWLWQPSARSKRVLWIKLFLVSCGLHILGLLLILVAYRGYYAHYDIILNQVPNVPVVFMPLHKSMHVRSGKQGDTHREKTGKPAPAIGKKEQSVCKQEQPSPGQVHEIQRQPTVQQGPTAVVAEQEKAVAPKKISPKKNNKKKVEKEKVTNTPKKNNKKKDAAAETVKKTVVPQIAKVPKTQQQEVSVAPVPIPLQKPVIQERIIESKPVQLSPKQMAEDSAVTAQNIIDQSIDMPQGQDVLCVGQVEWDALQVQEQIQQELEQHWNPPMGLNGDATCQIKVVIDWSGIIKQVTTQISSGVLAFDIHARSTVFAMHFPKVAWGKELILHFK